MRKRVIRIWHYSLTRLENLSDYSTQTGMPSRGELKSDALALLIAFLGNEHPEHGLMN